MLQASIERWEKIFLDTSVLMGIFKAIKGSNDENYNFSLRLINELSKDKSVNGRDRTFYISSISLSEILMKMNPGERLVSKIIQALNTANTEFVAFDESIAEVFVGRYHSILGNEPLNEFARSLGWPEHDLHMGREWVTRDIMIIASSEERGTDVLLTLDKKTMYPAASKLSVPCAVCFPGYFDYNDRHIFTYEETRVS